LQSIVWNGKDSSNVVVPAGTYTIKIYVVDKAGNKALTYPINKTVTVLWQNELNQHFPFFLLPESLTARGLRLIDLGQVIPSLL
jgi:hypothetical protein